MQWRTSYIHIPQYEHVSTNQHGCRYKKIGPKRAVIVRLSCLMDNPERVEDMRMLILLSSQLDLPVRYDFDADPQVAYIEVVGKEAL